MGIRATIQEGGKTAESSLGRGHPGGGLGPWGAAQSEEGRDSAWGGGGGKVHLCPRTRSALPWLQRLWTQSTAELPPQARSLQGPHDSQDLAQTRFFPPAPSAPPLSFPSQKPGSWARCLCPPHLPSLSRHSSLSSSVYSCCRHLSSSQIISRLL